MLILKKAKFSNKSSKEERSLKGRKIRSNEHGIDVQKKRTGKREVFSEWIDTIEKNIAINGPLV